MDVNEITRPRWKDRAKRTTYTLISIWINSQASVMGDPSELREVLVMVFNAVDAMPEGGRLTLSAAEVEGSLEIAISDTGIGMNPDVQCEYSTPSSPPKEGRHGSGLAVVTALFSGTTELSKLSLKSGRAQLRYQANHEAQTENRNPEQAGVRLTLVSNSNIPQDFGG
jgi:phosphoglycerate-specific signal transduction histidine kinase